MRRYCIRLYDLNQEGKLRGVFVNYYDDDCNVLRTVANKTKKCRIESVEFLTQLKTRYAIVKYRGFEINNVQSEIF
jgi:hypothetical protein